MVLCAYTPAMRGLVLTQRVQVMEPEAGWNVTGTAPPIVLRTRYAMSVTGIGYFALTLVMQCAFLSIAITLVMRCPLPACAKRLGNAFTDNGYFTLTTRSLSLPGAMTGSWDKTVALWDFRQPTGKASGGWQNKGKVFSMDGVAPYVLVACSDRHMVLHPIGSYAPATRCPVLTYAAPGVQQALHDLRNPTQRFGAHLQFLAFDFAEERALKHPLQPKTITVQCVSAVSFLALVLRTRSVLTERMPAVRRGPAAPGCRRRGGRRLSGSARCLPTPLIPLSASAADTPCAILT
eukprot:3336909-Rhodomonas_salina.3